MLVEAAEMPKVAAAAEIPKEEAPLAGESPMIREGAL